MKTNLQFLIITCLLFINITYTSAQTLEEKVNSLEQQITALNGDRQRLLEEMNAKIAASEEKTKQQYEAKLKEQAESLISRLETTENARKKNFADLMDLITRSQKNSEDLMSKNVPIGTIFSFAGSLNSLPENWKLCDGMVVDADTYPKLWDVIQTTWGGNDRTNFKLPDLRGLFLRGVDTDGIRDKERKTENKGLGSIQKDSTKRPNNDFITDDPGNHQHDSPTNDGNPGSSEVPNQSNGVDYASSAKTNGAGSHKHKIVEGGDFETRPINAAVYWIIKVKD
jgi:hypothetical protein